MKLTYTGGLHTYNRPLYYKDVNVRRRKCVMQDGEITDFRKKILNAFELCIHRQNIVALSCIDDSTEIGMKVLVYTPVQCSLIATIKNIADALNNHAFKDDRCIRIIQAEQLYADKPYIRIFLYTYDTATAKYIKGINFTADNIIPTNTIFPIRRSVFYTCERNWKNKKNKKVIHAQLSAQYANRQPQRNISMAISMFFNSAKRNRADIDNIALMLLSGMKGLVFNSLKDITALSLKLEPTTQNDYAEIIVRHQKLQRH